LAHSLTKMRFMLLLVVLALLAVGCQGQLPSSSWPGLGSADSTLYVATGPKVLAIDTTKPVTTSLWAFPPADVKSGEMFYAPPVRSGNQLFVGSFQDKLHALSADSGALMWTFPTGGGIVGSVSVTNGVVYLGADDRKVYALSADNGTKKWEFSMKNWGWATPVYREGKLYVGSTDHHLYCLNAADGNVVWDFQAKGAIASSPQVSGGKVYFGDFERAVYALDAATGKQIWTTTTQGWVWGSPALAGNVLYVADLTGNVYAFGTENGAAVWSQPFNAGGAVRGDMLVRDGVVYLVAEHGHADALNAATGAPKWQYTSDLAAKQGGFLSTPILSGDVLYVVSAGGFVYGIDTANGSEKWTFSPPQG
jgi:eukaryotic-like serine/threonine-protein kinase